MTLLVRPPNARALYVLAHGAGAGMRHPFLEEIAHLLAQREIATLRYEFPYMEQGRQRVDPPEIAHVRVREAVAIAAQEELPLFAGGKSFGGRMTSQAQAIAPLRGVRGLVFLGFPLHPPDKPGRERAEHLAGVDIPMLFVSGTRDGFARLPLLRATVKKAGADLVLVEDGDHSLHVRRKVTGKRNPEVLAEVADSIAEWMFSRTGPGRSRGRAGARDRAPRRGPSRAPSRGRPRP